MLSQRYRQIIKKVVFGETLLAQEFFIGLQEPQTEISVWLHGLGAPLDVTHRHSMACAAPFTICVAFDEGEKPKERSWRSLALKFCQRSYDRRVLGEIGLKLVDTISAAGFELCLFEARNSANHCLPKVRLYAHYLLHIYSERRMAGTSGMKMTFLEKRAAMVNFIRPHPVVLVSLVWGNRGNIFPMNIMGDLGRGYFAFALKDSRKAAHLVEGSGRIALSSLPMSHAPLAYQLAINHTKECIAWNQLPFATKASSRFGIPVPVFAPRVREMEVDKIHKIGSHTFFVAHIVTDETCYADPVLCVVHGFYQAWRLKGRSRELQISVMENSSSKHGVYRPETNSTSCSGAENTHMGTAP
jgi:flavin reductase (DIM6/NTAB) family NADH-FMN oxidoreductase RutF